MNPPNSRPSTLVPYEEIEISRSDPRGNVLVVDDDVRLRKLFCRSLESLGYPALQAESGREALALYEEHADAIGVVITDLAMPGMNGYELVEHLRMLRPELPIVVTSGLADAERIGDLRKKGAVRFLPKPFSRSDLEEALT